MFDPDDEDHPPLLIDPQENAVVTAPGTAVLRQWVSQWLAEPTRVVSQRTGDEFHDGSRDFVRKTL